MKIFWLRQLLGFIIAFLIAFLLRNVVAGLVVFIISLVVFWGPIYAKYAKDNPQQLWFKRKIFGWGWTPVTWQGWLVIAFGLAILGTGVYVAEIDDAPGAALVGAILMIAVIIGFALWKGEKPRWQWGEDFDKYK